jgi:succinate dehydrogenase / fumarate reductase iron-sulfur subunit
MRHFKDGQELTLEPWRARAFPAIKDLVLDRRSFDRIIEAGGYISVSTGNAPDGNTILVGKDMADRAMDAAACIGCGACVAACPNASAAPLHRSQNHPPRHSAPGQARAGQACAEYDRSGKY